MSLNEAQVAQIVEMVVQKLSAAPGSDAPAPTKTGIADGVFPEMEEAVQAAAEAQVKLVALPLATREKIIQAIRDTGRARAEEYGRLELEETDLGAAEGTALKIQTACQVPGIEDLAPEVYTGDLGVTIIERIPAGVVASVNPVTNAAPAIIHNGIMILAGGNTVVHNPHPRTRHISARTVRDLNQAIVAAGGPPNCCTTVEEPSVETAQSLMTHPTVKLIIVAGGHAVVEFATRTGKRVIAGGPGNPPVVVDETADLDHAARCIIRGASFSWCTPCSSEKEIFVVNSVADRLKDLLKKYGAYEITAAQGEALLEKIFRENRGPRAHSVMNLDLIGKPPSVILKRALGLEIPAETKIALLETDKDHPLVWTEQIMPILPFVRCRDAEEAMVAAIEAEQGMRHTMVIHSNSLNNLSRMASLADASQFVKNGTSMAGVGIDGEGFKSLHISTGGEGLARPRNFTLIRRCVLTDDFRYRFGA